MKPVGKCSKCGQDAKVNTPYLDDDNNLVCYRCAEYDSDKHMYYGIDQFKDDSGEYVMVESYSYRTFVLNRKKSDNWFAYFNSGSKFFPLKYEEQKLSYIEIFEIMEKYLDNDIRRCTGCGKDILLDDVAGYHLFAGINCDECWEKHKKHLEKQRRNGEVCGMCRKPYDDCCC